MNIKNINKIAIGLFFIYILLFSSDIQLILNCGLQKMMKENIYFRHVLIFASIYLFVFILKWYDLDVITVKEKFSNLEEDKIKEDNIKEYEIKERLESEEKEIKVESVIKKIKNKTTYLVNSIFTTLLAYLIFLISTKVDVVVFKYIILVLFTVIFIQVLSKAYNEDFHLLIIDYRIIFPKTDQQIYEISKEKNLKYDKFLIVIHNISYILYSLIILLMIIGVIKYYKSQRKTYGNKWNWNKFIFGIQKCKSIK
jgi:hypothetical protein